MTVQINPLLLALVAGVGIAELWRRLRRPPRMGILTRTDYAEVRNLMRHPSTRAYIATGGVVHVHWGVTSNWECTCGFDDPSGVLHLESGTCWPMREVIL